jgi:hypothetical protein
VNDGDTPLAQTVKERGFPNVRTSYYCYRWQFSHE